MMRGHAALSAGLAALLVLPSLGGGGDDPAVLDAALARTARALAAMNTLEQRTRAQDPGVIADVLAFTEPAHLPATSGGEVLESLRREVSLLQMELDQLEAAPATGAPPAPAPGTPAPGEITTGLDDAVRATLHLPLEGEAASPAAARTPAPLPPRESGGYSADPLRQAIASYRAGRPERALALLAEREDLESLYWRSRCLTDLERVDEAITLLGRITSASGDDFAGRRAATDLEFLRWKKDFRERLPRGLQPPASTGKGQP